MIVLRSVGMAVMRQSKPHATCFASVEVHYLPRQAAQPTAAGQPSEKLFVGIAQLWRSCKILEALAVSIVSHLDIRVSGQPQTMMMTAYVMSLKSVMKERTALIPSVLVN